jgi:heme-degrading monooxygenase HmoA
VILELAQVPIAAGHEEQFVADLRTAASTILPRAQGFLGFEAHGWCVERPDVFLFTIRWETLEDHTEGFRGSDLFTEWRTLIGPHFAEAPHVEHFG